MNAPESPSEQTTPTPAQNATQGPIQDESIEAETGLAGDLSRLTVRANGEPITTLADRGNVVAIILLSAPFVVIPIPGISTAVGGVILALSVAVMFSSNPWLPGWVRRKSVSFETLSKLVNGSKRVLKFMQKFMEPRIAWFATPKLNWLHGLSLVAASVALMLPIPIPMNNAPPAIGILLLALGLLERDGLMLLIGHIYTWIMWLILIIVAIVFWSAVSGYVTNGWSKVSGLLGG
jgi:hypothetical protein